MAHAAVLVGKVICFRCRAAEARCRCSTAKTPGGPAKRYGVTPSMLGLWLAGAALAGSCLGAALALLHG